MKIFGHPPIPSPTFKKITSFEDVIFSSANDIVFFKDTLPLALELGAKLQANNTAYAVEITDLTHFLLFANLGAKFALIDSDPTPYQTLAKEYVLDILILKIITHAEEIEQYGLLGIDGVIFQKLLL